jgi:hypothetical protein
MPTIIDRRAYKPLCVYCHDVGCVLCEANRAEAFAHRLVEDDLEELQQEVIEYVQSRCVVNRGNYMELRIPRSDSEFCNLIMDAILYGMERERKKRHAPAPKDFDPLHERFDRLDLED